jgi:hypothetical protein
LLKQIFLFAQPQRSEIRQELQICSARMLCHPFAKIRNEMNLRVIEISNVLPFTVQPHAVVNVFEIVGII